MAELLDIDLKIFHSIYTKTTSYHASVYSWFWSRLGAIFCDLDIQAVNKISLIKQKVLMNLKLLYFFYFSILFAQQQ